MRRARPWKRGISRLKEGEEHGLKDYEEAVDDVDESARALFMTRLIPAQQRHIATLDGMIAKIKRVADWREYRAGIVGSELHERRAELADGTRKGVRRASMWQVET